MNARWRMMFGGTAVPLFDNFNRPNTSGPNGLGVTSTNGAAWQVVNGDWRISNNQAYTPTSSSANPIAVVDAKTPDVDISLNVDIGGDALYARVVDLNNWFRVRTRYYSTTSSYQCCDTCYRYTYCPDCQPIGGYGGTCLGRCGCGGCDGCSGGCGNFACAWQNSICGSYSCNCRTCYSTNYYRRLYFEKMVGGNITQIGSVGVSTSSVRVKAVGNQWWFGYNGSLQYGPYTHGEHSNSTKHGIGRGSSSISRTSIDNFNLSPVTQ